MAWKEHLRHRISAQRLKDAITFEHCCFHTAAHSDPENTTRTKPRLDWSARGQNVDVEVIERAGEW